MALDGAAHQTTPSAEPTAKSTPEATAEPTPSPVVEAAPEQQQEPVVASSEPAEAAAEPVQAIDYREKMKRARGAVDRSNQRIHEMLDRVIAKEEEVNKIASDVEQGHHDRLNGQISDMQTMLHDLAAFSNGGPVAEVAEPTPAKGEQQASA